MKLALLFTGQGSQVVGMGRDLAERFPQARATFDEADAVLGEPLRELCFHGPEQRLGLTEFTQPATLAVSIAAYRALGRAPDLAAGHSLGEYSALVAAGSLGFADAVRLVRERARCMQEAVPPGKGGMVVLRKLALAEVEALVARVTAGVCEVANYNAPGQYVVAGDAAAMAQVVELAGARHALPLPVSVPFHCSLLRPAAERFAQLLRRAPMQDPAFPIWCNADAAPVTTAAPARDALERQFAGPVRWEASVRGMLYAGARRFVECGPKAVLIRMVTQIANACGVEGVEVQAATTAEEVEQLRG